MPLALIKNVAKRILGMCKAKKIIATEGVLIVEGALFGKFTKKETVNL